MGIAGMLTPLDTILARDMVIVALLSPFVLAGLKPFLGRLPIFAPASPDRDVAMNVVLYLVNLVLLCGALSADGALDLRYWLAIILAAGGQHAAGAVAYQALKNTIPTVQKAKAKANDVVQLPPPDGALYVPALPDTLPPDIADAMQQAVMASGDVTPATA